jgi:hypothetical protein
MQILDKAALIFNRQREPNGNSSSLDANEQRSVPLEEYLDHDLYSLFNHEDRERFWKSNIEKQFVEIIYRSSIATLSSLEGTYGIFNFTEDELTEHEYICKVPLEQVLSHEVGAISRNKKSDHLRNDKKISIYINNNTSGWYDYLEDLELHEHYFNDITYITLRSAYDNPRPYISLVHEFCAARKSRTTILIDEHLPNNAGRLVLIKYEKANYTTIVPKSYFSSGTTSYVPSRLYLKSWQHIFSDVELDDFDVIGNYNYSATILAPAEVEVRSSMLYDPLDLHGKLNEPFFLDRYMSDSVQVGHLYKCRLMPRDFYPITTEGFVLNDRYTVDLLTLDAHKSNAEYVQSVDGAVVNIDASGGLGRNFNSLLRISEPIFLLWNTWANQYGHFLADQLPKIQLIKNFSWWKSLKFLIAGDSENVTEMLKAVGIQEDRIIRLNTTCVVECDHLIVCSRLNGHDATMRYHPYFYKSQLDINSALRANVAGQESPELIYLSRGDVATRNIINENDVVKNLIPLGFKVFTGKNKTTAQQAAYFSKAKFIVGPQGTAFSNLAFAPKNTVIFELFHDVYWNEWWKRMAAILDMKYAYMRYPAIPVEGYPRWQSNFEIDVADLTFQIKRLMSLAD